MTAQRGVSGIEHLPIYVVATEQSVWAVTEEDYVASIPLAQLVGGLEADQHIYLVHLDTYRPGDGVKLTQLY